MANWTCWHARRNSYHCTFCTFLPDYCVRGVTPFHKLRVPEGSVSFAHWGIFFKLELYAIEALLATILASNQL